MRPQALKLNPSPGFSKGTVVVVDRHNPTCLLHEQTGSYCFENNNFTLAVVEFPKRPVEYRITHREPFILDMYGLWTSNGMKAVSCPNCITVARVQ